MAEAVEFCRSVEFAVALRCTEMNHRVSIVAQRKLVAEVIRLAAEVAYLRDPAGTGSSESHEGPK